MSAARPSKVLAAHRASVLVTAERLGAHNVRVFGSVARGEDTERSDVDLLVDVPRGTTLLDMARLQRALEDELGIAVDVLTAGDFPPGIRERILQEAVPL